uniref:WD domain, G-beta repeat-containing protein n=1 Tax=Toxoplasma gondii COUG TaxID=1074873 RepID=A0A2G8Y5N1_TOXGO|nr:WD domain, G-beta repeat-containing protein [Toxoplasma gondii COUG]
MASAEAVPVVVTLGTYDGGLMGYTVQLVSPEGKGDYSRQTQSAERLKLTFAVNAHVGCVKAIASSPSLLLTGSTDESIRIYNLESRREIGVLTSPSGGTVNCLSLVGNAFLLSGDTRGRVRLWRGSSWEMLRSLDTTKATPPQKGRKSSAKRLGRARDASADDSEEEEQIRQGRKGVESLAVHPSGRLCLVLTADGTLQLWNLLTATCAVRTPLAVGERAESVRWPPQAATSLYGRLSARRVSLHNIADSRTAALEVETVKDDEKQRETGAPVTWTSFCFASEALLLVGDSRGRIWGVHTPKSLLSAERPEADQPALRPSFCFKGKHASRIKGLEIVGLEELGADARISFVSADASGCMHLWSFRAPAHPAARKKKEGEDDLLIISPQAHIETRCRVTCLSSSLTPAAIAQEAGQEPLSFPGEKPKRDSSQTEAGEDADDEDKEEDEEAAAAVSRPTETGRGGRSAAVLSGNRKKTSEGDRASLLEKEGRKRRREATPRGKGRAEEGKAAQDAGSTFKVNRRGGDDERKKKKKGRFLVAERTKKDLKR